MKLTIKDFEDVEDEEWLRFSEKYGIYDKDIEIIWKNGFSRGRLIQARTDPRWRESEVKHGNTQ